MTDHERDQAIKEGHRNAAAEAYLKPRKAFRMQRAQLFEAGFDRGYDAAAAPLLERIAEQEKEIIELQRAVSQCLESCGEPPAEGSALERLWLFAMGEPLSVPAYVKAKLEQQAEAQEPCAWRHSKTFCLYETEEEVPLADGDEWAEPLFTRPQPAQLQALSEEEAREALLGFSEDSSTYEDNIDGLAKCIQSALAAKNGAVLT